MKLAKLLSSLVLPSLALLCGIVPDAAHAQDNEALIGAVNDSINQSVNAQVLFASQGNLTGGDFTIDNPDGAEANATLYKVGGSYEFGQPEKTVRPFLDFSAAALKVTRTIAPLDNSGGEDDFSKTKTYTITGGAGLDVKAAEGLHVRGGFDLAWNHLSNEYDFNNPLSQGLAPRVTGQAVGWDLDVLTTIPFAELIYDVKLLGALWTVHSRYAQLFNDSVSTDSDIIEVDSNTGFWQNGIEAEFPLGIDVAEFPLVGKGIFTRNDISGEALKAIPFSYYYTVTGEVLADIKSEGWWLKRAGLTVGYSFGDDFDGTTIGLAADWK